MLRKVVAQFAKGYFAKKKMFQSRPCIPRRRNQRGIFPENKEKARKLRARQSAPQAAVKRPRYALPTFQARHLSRNFFLAVTNVLVCRPHVVRVFMRLSRSHPQRGSSCFRARCLFRPSSRQRLKLCCQHCL